MRARIFGSHLSRRQRRVYAAAAILFGLVFVATMWPIYPLFAAAEPLVLGLPLSLFYLVVLLATTFTVLLAVFLWEGRGEDAPYGSDSGEAPYREKS